MKLKKIWENFSAGIIFVSVFICLGISNHCFIFLQGILKDKDQILSKWIDGYLSLDSKYLNPRNLVYGDIDNLVWQWYKKNHTEGQRITGNQIRDTALRLAKELGYDKFTASNGWLISWQKRHSIKPSSTHLQNTANRVL